MDSAEFGRRLRAARMATGLNQTQAATKLGLKQPSYAPYELGRKVPSVVNLMAWIDVLGLDPAIIFPEFASHPAPPEI